MSRFIPQPHMSADDLIRCSYQARAILALCESAAWAIHNGGPADVLAGAIETTLSLAAELLEPVHDALETHEGLKGGAE